MTVHTKPPALARWHELVVANDPAGLDALLADDVVFQSPAVHAPQPGKALAEKYLRAAMKVLFNPTFRYVDEWSGESSAVLEFALEIDGVQINGVDIIRWNDDDKITNFKVMIRPMKALTTIVALMQQQLAPSANPA